MNIFKFLAAAPVKAAAYGCLVGLLVTSAPLEAAPGGLKRLDLAVSARNRTATAVVPPGIGVVTLQRFENPGGWRKVATKNAIDGRVAFKLPKAGKEARWRALGRMVEEIKPQRKFPDGFYQGKNVFEPTLGEELNQFVSVDSFYVPMVISNLSMTGMSLTSATVDAAAGTSIIAATNPVEADIWRTDGGKVYFFNQLRGLQILDLSDPADPRLVASLRLAAVGEDLYLLPGSGDSRTLVLLTRVNGGAAPATRINMVNVTKSTVQISHRHDVPGVLAGSRMVGNKLALVTTERPNSRFRWSAEPPDSKTSVSQWHIASGQTPVAAGQATLQGTNPVVAAGSEWLAVAVTPPWDAKNSEVSVFSLGQAELPSLTPSPVRTAGIVLDKFKLQWSNNVLTTISEKRRISDSWVPPVTVLENFATTTGNPLLASLELARGENLYATRFAGNKAYIVTFRETDPLWVIDLSDPAKPFVAGHVEVPGWSTYLEPIGDLLFSVGWESGTLAASLFDVASPANPTLLRRINLGSRGTHSEAAWNEKALRILPEIGLVMIPLTVQREPAKGGTPVLQLLDLDLAARDLKQRGVIEHEFDARRSAMIGNAVVSISQKTLVAADVTNRDLPQVLAEVSLAWPVDRVFESGAHLLQVESGGTYAGRATVRISPANDTEAILAEIDLGDGRVHSAAVRDGKFFVLRDDVQGLFHSGDVGTQRKLHLDIHDLSALPALKLLGSCSVGLDRGLRISGGDLLWPRPNRPAVMLSLQNGFRPFYPQILTPSIMPTITIGGFESLSITGAGLLTSYPISLWPREAPKLLVFDTTEVSAPLAGQPVAIGTDGTVSNGIQQAADGLVVVGTADWKYDLEKPVWGSRATQSLHVVEIGASGDPVVRPGIDLPGTLFAVTELDRDGFLAFTRGTDGKGKPRLQATACDGFDAFEVATLEVANSQLVSAAGGRRLFVSTDEGFGRFRLSDEGVFVSENALQLGFQPTALSWLAGILIGRNPHTVFAADPLANDAVQWPVPAPGLLLQNVTRAADGDLLAPLGNYGAARLDR